jgi:hypothetical protein
MLMAATWACTGKGKGYHMQGGTHQVAITKQLLPRVHQGARNVSTQPRTLTTRQSLTHSSSSALLVDVQATCPALLETSCPAVHMLLSLHPSHIPDGPGYQEKFYFSPGDTGFKVFNTRYGKLGGCY